MTFSANYSFALGLYKTMTCKSTAKTTKKMISIRVYNSTKSNVSLLLSICLRPSVS